MQGDEDDVGALLAQAADQVAADVDRDHLVAQSLERVLHAAPERSDTWRSSDARPSGPLRGSLRPPARRGPSRWRRSSTSCAPRLGVVLLASDLQLLGADRVISPVSVPYSSTAQ